MNKTLFLLCALLCSVAYASPPTGQSFGPESSNPMRVPQLWIINEFELPKLTNGEMGPDFANFMEGAFAPQKYDVYSTKGKKLAHIMPGDRILFSGRLEDGNDRDYLFTLNHCESAFDFENDWELSGSAQQGPKFEMEFFKLLPDTDLYVTIHTKTPHFYHYSFQMQNMFPFYLPSPFNYSHHQSRELSTMGMIPYIGPYGEVDFVPSDYLVLYTYTGQLTDEQIERCDPADFTQ